MLVNTRTFDKHRGSKGKRASYSVAPFRKIRQNRATLKVISSSRTVRNLPIFPPELYRNIIVWITDRQDLYNLSLSSRIWSAEAQRILYSVIDLAQNTRAPVLWADTMLGNSRKALMVRALTLRFDLSFLIVPDLLLSSLRSIAQALKALRRLDKLVLVGHPLAMMHPIHAWILDGCTAELQTFHNSVFPPWAVVPFLSRHPQIREWKQTGQCPRGIITDTVLPHLTMIDAHVSTLSSFTRPRSITKLRLKMDGWGRETARERETIVALSLFGTTLTTLIIEDLSTENQLKLAELLVHLAKATPNLKTLAYTNTSPLGVEDILSSSSIENLSMPVMLETLILQLQCQKLCTNNHRVRAIAKHAFVRCPSLRCVALKEREKFSFCKRQGSCIAEDDINSLFSDVLDSDQPPPRSSRIPEYRMHSPYITNSLHV